MFQRVKAAKAPISMITRPHWFTISANDSSHKSSAWVPRLVRIRSWIRASIERCRCLEIHRSLRCTKLSWDSGCKLFFQIVWTTRVFFFFKAWPKLCKIVSTQNWLSLRNESSHSKGIFRSTIYWEHTHTKMYKRHHNGTQFLFKND